MATLTHDQVVKRVRRVLAEVSGKDLEKIGPNDALGPDLEIGQDIFGGFEADLVALCQGIEDEFGREGLRFRVGQRSPFTPNSSVGDVVRFVETTLSKAA